MGTETGIKMGLALDASLKLEQRPVLTQELRHSLSVLQKPQLELVQYIKQEVANNPAVEVVDPYEMSIDEARDEFEKKESDIDIDENLDFNQRDFDDDYVVDYPDDISEGFEDEEKFGDDDWIESEFGVLERMSREEEEYIFQDGGNNENNADNDEKRQFMFDSLTRGESLQEHLLKQLELSDLSDEEKIIGEQIIGSIDDKGYLKTPLADISQITDISVEDVEKILAVIQDFTPSGVGARTPQECLLIQIRQDDELRGTLAEKIIRDCADLLESRKFSNIAKKLGVEKDDIYEAIDMLQRLSPNPGLRFTPSTNDFIVPDIIVTKVDGEYVVTIQNEYVPKIRISKYFERLAFDKNADPSARKYALEHVQRARNLQVEMENRESTLLRLARIVVDVQKEYFDIGVNGLKPLTMQDVAKQMNVNESTISRAVENKYVKSCQGIRELRTFFASGIVKTTQTEDGAEQKSMSTVAVKDILKRMVMEEDPSKPLTDQDIQEKFKEIGISVARRTVAKYRLALNIEPSHLRRRD